uniref:Uncharacterized protein n=1 Tax=OCS116 cluster bacterium TaxID=2030921 RepID=A0A2A4Z641_9PROT
MLRMSFMPSDFHPILLILGENSELLKFSSILDDFSKKGANVSLTDSGVFSTDTSVELLEIKAGSNDLAGLWRSLDDSNKLIWRLPKKFAWIFGNEVANLAMSGERAGSVTLECEALNEIRIKVSVGEWENHYLTDGTR